MDWSARRGVNKTNVIWLEKKLANKQRELQELQAQNSRLHSRHAILSAYCNMLAWIRGIAWEQLTEQPQQQHQQQQQQQGSMLATLQLASADELLLLEQLQLHPVHEQQQQQDSLSDAQHTACALHKGLSSATDGTTDTSQLLCCSEHHHHHQHKAGSIQTIAPDDDLLFILRRAYAMPPFPGAHSMTLQDIAREYNATIRDISLNLVLHQASVGRARDARDGASVATADRQPLQCIQASFDRYFGMIVTLIKLGRNDLLVSTALVNFETPTGCLLSEPDEAHHSQAVAAIDLSKEQQQQMADGIAVFSRLLQPIWEELKQLQLLEHPGSSSSTTDTAAAAPRGASNLSTLIHVANTITKQQQQQHGTPIDNREQLQLQEQRTTRMKLLLQKNMLVSAAFISYTMGRMTYCQLARLHCLMYPYYPHNATLVKLVCRQLGQQQQQQQQQQQMNGGQGLAQQQ